MFHPDADAGCKHCSFWADTFNPITIHLAHRDVSFAAVSRAPSTSPRAGCSITTGMRADRDGGS
jgi:predicted dithiol-disulfide oxidoreductase (DUF899 family)